MVDAVVSDGAVGSVGVCEDDVVAVGAGTCDWNDGLVAVAKPVIVCCLTLDATG